jgi:EAL domain-containing protein (putative c-di-GMP-specific phosphodiesterase class I)
MLPVTHLKIDGIFVRDVVADDRSQAMLSAIVQLARAMNLKTVAECVESEAIWQATRAGVEYGQGFSIGRPRRSRRCWALVGVPPLPEQDRLTQ